ncbi:hypothetical protein JQX09_17595 [Sulfitobacter pseudonitzschiae]|uniref:Uncharacterized protein n=1 Tax=Pseudosulfitobacter pseudonitzschiae TaxID=1402135 RepID=A0A9Q2P4L6_9RHOB|nr:hypothetical protein [Pseudosulfitobacter pseudonitzschiae]MBM2293746.1 hypothetical protein [Pseudosulfitobacter pseudonitzschiae]MBM2298664.1 hypothetical protein [Pseudosulfitobacter pseudonitzschiae]MBM2303578.1 hypothetical protein [Pseudosulfitobacter pseudonitzschiae]MBM2313361.1 hypothetical protein [Pseudosulfitobacter pseudonitzschiae]MBM2318274.1 hypothetical protein [Pseudosulfitobacter pseudonitzschiae]
MAEITSTLLTGTGARVVAETTLGASDTFVFKPGVNQVLTLRNASGGALTPNIDGDGGTSVPVAGVGSVDVSGGLTLASIANGAVVAIPTDTIAAYLKGVITITGADDMVATLTRF